MLAIIATVLNEGESIRGLMDSILAQTRPPDEIIFVDGGSRDHTVQILESYANRLPLKVLIHAGANISEGRNHAIRAAQADIIAITDAGVILSPNWLESLAQPFANPQIEVVCGFFHADARTVFEVALGATTLPLVEEIDPATFLPSSRSVAVRKRAWEAVDGYPEWLDFCEDLIFDLRLKARGNPFAFQGDAVAHFRPRKSLRAFFKQYYLYARGDGKADLWRKRHLIRYLTYGVAIPFIFWLGVQFHPLLWGLFIPSGAVYLGQPYRRLNAVFALAQPQVPATWSNRIQAMLWIPIIRVAGDIAKMIGYPVGWRWRLQHRPPDWRRIEKI